MSLDKQALFWLAATVGGYLLSRQLYRRVKWYWLSPIVFVPVLLYAPGDSHPYPLRRLRPRHQLAGGAARSGDGGLRHPDLAAARAADAPLAGAAGRMFAGTAVAIGSSWALAQALALDGQVTLSLLPRSITTPFAMEMSTTWAACRN